jgi:hypothetical protein
MEIRKRRQKTKERARMVRREIWKKKGERKETREKEKRR